MKEYAFDITVKAAVRVKACTLTDAVTQLYEKLDCAWTNFGLWDDGTPILGEASVHEHSLFEIDGEAV